MSAENTIEASFREIIKSLSFSLSFVIILLLSFFVSWAFGVDFHTRSPELGFSVLASLLVAAFLSLIIAVLWVDSYKKGT